MIILIGKSKFLDAATKQPKIYKYSDIPTDNGWVNASKALPIPFDLMFLQINGRYLTKFGWWTGQEWMGLNFRPTETIIKWKRKFEHT